MIAGGGNSLRIVCATVLVIWALHAHGQEKRLPTLGSRAPSWVLSARAHSETCLTNVNHRDPCAKVTIKEDAVQDRLGSGDFCGDLSTLTEDPHLVTDSELGVGGGCRLLDGADQPYPLTP
jgi:hypothetical protein